MNTLHTDAGATATFTLLTPGALWRAARTQLARLTVAAALVFGANVASAAPSRPFQVDIVPTITALNLVNGQLVASGTATAQLGAQSATAPFSNVPVTLALAADQTGAGACPILDLQLGPIELNLLGLLVETSPICLEITAYENQGLLGELLCAVANLLNGGLTLDQILGGQGATVPVLLPGLTQTQVSALLGNLTNLLNQALDELLGARLTSILELHNRQECAILNLALGPVDLNLLGLTVALDDCANGPVTVDITAVRGALLGNLLCALVESDQILVGNLLSEVLGRLRAGL